MYLGANTFLLKARAFRFSDKEFEQFCLDNKELRIERDENRNIIIMAPTFSSSGRINGELFRQVANWNVMSGLGATFDSSSGFTLPDGSMRSPDVCWISNAKWDALTNAEKNSYSPVCPEFVIELKSESDVLSHLEKKMEDTWLKNGVQLGLLIDPETQQTQCYRPNQSKEILAGFDRTVPCDPVLPGCMLDLSLLDKH